MAVCICQDHTEVRSGNLTIYLNKKGEIQRVFTDALHEKFVKGCTVFDNCVLDEKVSATKLANGGIAFRKLFVSKSDKNKSCWVIESFEPTENSIRWKIAINGTGDSWSTGIRTLLSFEKTEINKFWTTWGDPGQTQPYQSYNDEQTRWTDPLQFMPFRDMHLVYGGHFCLGGGYSVPLVTVVDEADNSGLSLIMSPEDMLFDVHLETTADGEIRQTRLNNRINQTNMIVFAMDIISHSADWRAPLGWMVKRYPEYFNPVCDQTGEISGCGAYSAFEGDVDVNMYKRMGGIVNWKASFDFPYMGLFIPPVTSDSTQWARFNVNSSGNYSKYSKKYTSISQMARYTNHVKKDGFHLLNYFNVTEFGGASDFSDQMEYPDPKTESLGNEKDWKNPNIFLYKNFPDALLFGSTDYENWSSVTGEQLMFPKPLKHDKPFYTWGEALATDCGDPAYQEFLLNQANLHVVKFPDASGICVDRLDWLNDYNWKYDDQVSWMGDHPARSLLASWKEFIPRLASIFHNANKVVYCNPLTNRIELMRHMDGIYNEYGQRGYALNLSAFLTLNKTFIAWTPDAATVNGNPDEYFQRHLYLGAFPTAPFPGNDHTIIPDGTVEKLYLEYGFLFNRLHGKKWVLVPDLIKIENQSALANIFRTGDGYVIPIVFAKEKEGVVRVDIKKKGELASCQTIQAQSAKPGEEKFSVVKVNSKTNSFIVEVPVHKGCAMLELRIN
jgi:hypothetical protein